MVQAMRAMRTLLALFLAGMLFGLTGCGGGDGDTPSVAPTITAQPTDTQLTQGANAQFQVSATADGATLSYQWQRSNDGGSTWIAIAGATTASLGLTAVSPADNGARFRVVVAGSGPQTTSSAATLTVAALVLPPSISVQPSAQQVTEGQAASFAVTATGTALSYQWQRSSDGLAWADIADATQPTLQLSAVTLNASGQQYRVLLRNSASTVNSNAVALTVLAAPASPVFSSQPASTAVTAPSPASFSAVVTGNPLPSLQWQRSTDLGANYSDIAGATAASYTTPATTVGDNGSLLRLRAVNTAGTTLSAAVTLSVSAALSAPLIQQQPLDITVAAGQTANWTVTSSGNPQPTYQWQLSTDGGASFANINGATSASYSVVAASADNSRRIRVVVSNSQGTASSRASLLTVAPSAGSYYGIGLSTVETNKNTLHIIDPANPGTALLSRDVDGPLGIGEFMLTSALSRNAAASTITDLGSPLVFYIHDRQLYQVALTKPGTPTAQRISSLADACQFDGVDQLDDSGLDAWVAVRTAGADGSCDDGLDNRVAFVRTGSSVASAATLLPVGVYLTAGHRVEDSSGKLLWMLASDNSVASVRKLVAFSPTLAQVDVAGSADVQSVGAVTIDTPLSAGPLVGADRLLRRLRGDAGSLSLDPSIYAFTSLISGLGLVEGSAVLFPDGERMMKVQGSTAPTVLATLPAGSGRIIGLTQNSTHLVVQQLGTAGLSVSAISKSTGAVLQLLIGDGLNTIRNPAGLDGDTLYYFTGNGSKVGDLRRIQLDGSGDALVTAGLFPVGALVTPVLRADFTQLFFGVARSMLYCVPATAAADCRSGSLMQRDLSTGTVTRLGAFSGSSGAPVWSLTGGGTSFGISGGTVLTSGSANSAMPGYAKRDLWAFIPGQANSLARVTNNMP